MPVAGVSIRVDNDLEVRSAFDIRSKSHLYAYMPTVKLEAFATKRRPYYIFRRNGQLQTFQVRTRSDNRRNRLQRNCAVNKSKDSQGAAVQLDKFLDKVFSSDDLEFRKSHHERNQTRHRRLDVL